MSGILFFIFASCELLNGFNDIFWVASTGNLLSFFLKSIYIWDLYAENR